MSDGAGLKPVSCPDHSIFWWHLVFIFMMVFPMSDAVQRLGKNIRQRRRREVIGRFCSSPRVSTRKLGIPETRDPVPICDPAQSGFLPRGSEHRKAEGSPCARASFVGLTASGAKLPYGLSQYTTVCRVSPRSSSPLQNCFFWRTVDNTIAETEAGLTTSQSDCCTSNLPHA